MTDTSAQLGIVYLDDSGTPIRRRFSAAAITPPTPATDADVPASNKVDVFHIVVDAAGKKRGVYAGSFTITEKTVMEFIAELESDPLLRASVIEQHRSVYAMAMENVAKNGAKH